MQLSPRDIDILQAGILELNSHRDLKQFRAALPRIMLELIPADYFCWNELLVSPQAQTVKAVDFVESREGVFVPFAERLAAIAYEHPFTRPFTENPNPTALMFSDFYTLKELRKTNVHRVGYAPEGLFRLLAVPIQLHAGLISSLNFACRNKDFRERDRQVLNVLRAHFKQAYRNAELATARATALSKPLIAYQLTPREAEIAIWLAEGKSNPEIAAILGLSARTIEKNMEHILEKLGVENRTTAALMIAGANASGN